MSSSNQNNNISLMKEGEVKIQCIDGNYCPFITRACLYKHPSKPIGYYNINCKNGDNCRGINKLCSQNHPNVNVNNNLSLIQLPLKSPESNEFINPFGYSPTTKNNSLVTTEGYGAPREIKINQGPFDFKESKQLTELPSPHYPPVGYTSSKFVSDKKESNYSYPMPPLPKAPFGYTSSKFVSDKKETNPSYPMPPLPKPPFGYTPLQKDTVYPTHEMFQQIPKPMSSDYMKPKQIYDSSPKVHNKQPQIYENPRYQINLGNRSHVMYSSRRQQSRSRSPVMSSSRRERSRSRSPVMSSSRRERSRSRSSKHYSRRERSRSRSSKHYSRRERSRSRSSNYRSRRDRSRSRSSKHHSRREQSIKQETKLTQSTDNKYLPNTNSQIVIDTKNIVIPYVNDKLSICCHGQNCRYFKMKVCHFMHPSQIDYCLDIYKNTGNMIDAINKAKEYKDFASRNRENNPALKKYFKV